MLDRRGRDRKTMNRSSSSFVLWTTSDNDAASIGDSTFISTSRLAQDKTITGNGQSQLGQPPHRFLLRGNAWKQPHQSPSWHQDSPRPIHVSQSCLLIPVFLAAWWYYTKQCLRKVRGLLRNIPETDDGSTERFRDKFFRVGEGHMKW